MIFMFRSTHQRATALVSSTLIVTCKSFGVRPFLQVGNGWVSSLGPGDEQRTWRFLYLHLHRRQLSYIRTRTANVILEALRSSVIRRRLNRQHYRLAHRYTLTYRFRKFHVLDAAFLSGVGDGFVAADAVDKFLFDTPAALEIRWGFDFD